MNLANRATLMLIALFFAAIIFLSLPFTFPYIALALGLASHFMLWLLDCMAGVHILPFQPWACWTIVGCLFGALLGFWTVAPALGFKKSRSLIGILPLATILLLTVVDITVSVARQTAAPPQTAVQTAPQATPQNGTLPSN